MSRLKKLANANLKKVICKIDNKEIICEIINENYNDHAIEVNMLSGNNIGVPAVVEKDDILCEDQPLTVDYKTNKKDLLKSIKYIDIDKVSIELIHYLDDYEKSYVVAYIKSFDDDENIDIAYTSDLITCDDNTKLLKKEQNKMKTKINNWLNGNYDIELIEVFV